MYENPGGATAPAADAHGEGINFAILVLYGRPLSLILCYNQG